MKRIDIPQVRLRNKYGTDVLTLCDISEAINEIMDYLEVNLPVKNGQFYKCKNCGHISMYKDEIHCCSNPDWEIYNE